MMHIDKRKMLFPLILFTSLLIYTSAYDTKIVNGTDADEGEFKFIVSLRNASRHTCGGTILSKDYILTAAHCVCSEYAPFQLKRVTSNNSSSAVIYIKFRNLSIVTPMISEFYINHSRNVSRLSVQYGLLEINTDDENAIPVEEITCNDGYDPAAHYIYDIAILKLEESIPEEYVTPTKLAEPNFNTSESLDGMVIGWGRNATNAFLPTILQKVDVKIYSDEICDAAHDGVVDLEHHICSGIPENGKGSCQGDSGGPLLYGDIQVGVVSWGTAGNCGISNETHPKVLARVSSYSNWIKQTAKLSASPITISMPLIFTIITFSFIKYAI